MNIDEQLAWFSGLEDTPEYHAEELKTEFAVQIERMMLRHGITKSELARRMGTSPAYITKVLRGDANVTIDTMAKLAWHADGRVHLRVTDKDADGRWFEVIETHQPASASQCAQQWANAHAGERAA